MGQTGGYDGADGVMGQIGGGDRALELVALEQDSLAFSLFSAALCCRHR